MFTALFTPAAAAAQAPATAARPDPFNYAIGTQTIGAAYQFTEEERLVETARSILAMGSNLLKFRLDGRYFSPKNGNVRAANPAIHSLIELVRDEPAHRRVLELPFAYYVMWAYPFAPVDWHRGLSPADREKEYREIYELACHLLKTCDGTGKTFYLGHWEGDWSLRGSGNTKDEERVRPEAIQGMIDWLNARQQAVDDARRDTPHRGVEVYHYTEVNLARLAMEGRKTVCRDVLPKTRVDYVSYSCYDTQKEPAKLKAALDYIESRLPPKPGLPPGRRVWIGEYGFPAAWATPAQQEEWSRQVMRAGLEWGCPFVLYWELYNNEVGADGKQRGFWLIDDHGALQPVYHTHRRFYAWARAYAAGFAKSAGRPPTFDEFRRTAAAYLEHPVADCAAP